MTHIIHDDVTAGIASVRSPCVTTCMPGTENERLERMTRALGTILSSR
jgi:hypothetical protein